MTRARLLSSLAAGALAAASVVVGPGAHADGSKWAPPGSDPLAVELFKINRDKKTNFKDAGGKTWGRAQEFVDASVKEVRTAVLDYGNYSQFIPRFQKTKLLKREANGSADVYLQMPILKGAATLWAMEKFDPPVAEGKGEKIVGHYVKGNVEELEAIWHYRPIDDKHSIVTLELHVIPKLAVPEKLLTSQIEDACGEGVIGVREKAESLGRLVASKK